MLRSSVVHLVELVILELQGDVISPGKVGTGGLKDHVESVTVGASMQIVNVLVPSVVVVHVCSGSVSVGTTVVITQVVELLLVAET